MPNTHVRWRPATLGALVAAALWDVSKWGFGLYVSRALPYLKLYGALGLIPLFLLWLYVNWLIILFGLEIAFTLQAMRGRLFESTEASGALKCSDPMWLLPVVAAIARASRAAEPLSRQRLAEDLDLRLESVAELVRVLEDEGLVLHTSRPGSEDVGLTLAVPAQNLPLARVLSIASRYSLGDKARQGPGWGALARLHETAREATGEKTVADVL
jgi:membrane protein